MRYFTLLICIVFFFACSDEKDENPTGPSGIPDPQDTQNPYVKITSPVNGVRINRNAIVRIEADASDNVGVLRVDFYTNGEFKHRDKNSPYYYDWKSPSNYGGRIDYILSVEAVDLSGNSNTHSISVWSSFYGY